MSSRVRAAVVAVATVATVGTAVAAAGSASADTYCKVVTAQDVRVFQSPSGDAYWTKWPRGTVFLTNRTDPPLNRYNTYYRDSLAAWVTSDPAYVRAC